jgi:hypothetical protein
MLPYQRQFIRLPHLLYVVLTGTVSNAALPGTVYKAATSVIRSTNGDRL